MRVRWRRRTPQPPPVPPSIPEYYSQCFIHHAAEPVDEAFHICGECGHVYPSAEALVTAWNDFVDELNERFDDDGMGGRPARRVALDDAATLDSCPLCHHDF